MIDYAMPRDRRTGDYYLPCKCGTVYRGGINNEQTAKAARAAGWTWARGVAKCPQCTAKKKESKK